MNNLNLFRRLSNVTKKEIALLTNITVHTYYAYEQDRMCIPREFVILISKIYGIDKHDILCNKEEITQSTIQKLTAISKLTEKERLSTLIYNLTGCKQSKVNFNQIYSIAEQIRKSL